MPAQPGDPQWLKDAYAEGRITENSVVPFMDGNGLIGNKRMGDIMLDAGLPPQNETDFEIEVVDYAQDLGWKVMAVRRNVCVQRADGTTHRCTPWLYDGEGWVDLVLVRNRVIHAELKSESGRASDKQVEWFDRLKKAGAEVYLWRPSDWPEIEKVLK
jgi:hypothetical protein